MYFTFGVMMEDKESKPANKKSSKSLTRSIKISLHSYEKLDRFRKKNKMTLQEVINQITSFIDKPNFSMSILEDRYELHQMNKDNRENHKLTNANFLRFTDDFLNKYEKSNTNTLNLLTHVIPKLIEISAQEEIKMLVEQNYKLSRALVSLEMEEQDAKKVLFDTANTVNEFRKNKEAKKSEVKNTDEQKAKASEPIDKEYLTIEGTVLVNPRIHLSTAKRFLYCHFYLKENLNTKEPKEHLAVLWEGGLTKKIGLTTQDAVKEYFGKIKAGDMFKFKGFYEIVKSKDSSGKEVSQQIFQATEIISHHSAKQNS